jgi:Mce-associated membrane protein
MNQITAATNSEKGQTSRRRTADGNRSSAPRRTAKQAVEEEVVQSDSDLEVDEEEGVGATEEDWDYEEAWPAEPEAAATPRRHFRTAPALVSAIGVILVAALGFCLYRIVDQSSENSLRSSALKAANQYGVYLSSYDYNDLNGPTAPWTLVEKNSTPAFRTDFDKTKASLSTLVRDYHATATGKVLVSGLSSVSSSRAVILLFIDQTVTNSAQKPGTETQPLRVELVLAHQHGKWLIDQLNLPS